MDDEVKKLLLEESMDLDRMLDFDNAHKRAFRNAFDFLNECFPPRWDDEYWKSVGERGANRMSGDPQNRLAHKLIVAVIDYLNDIVKDIPREEENADS